MGGIQWDALPIIIELLGIDDVALFIEHLTIIRNYQNRHGG